MKPGELQPSLFINHFATQMTIRQAYVMAAMQSPILSRVIAVKDGEQQEFRGQKLIDWYADIIIGIADACLKKELETRDD